MIVLVCFAFLAVVHGQDKNVVQLAEDLGLIRWVADIRKAGIEDKITAPDADLYTIFAPNDDAYDNLSQEDLDKLNSAELADILYYHIRCCGRIFTSEMHGLDGVNKCERKDGEKVVTVLNSKVIQANNEVPKAVIHVVDKVLFPPAPESNIAEYVLNNPSEFSNISAALTSTGLNDTLAGDGRFTLFAPNNAAFGKISSADLQWLMEDGDRYLKFLQNHVLDKAAYSPCLEDGTELPTMGEDPVKISISGDTIMISGSTIVKMDIPLKNGVIHVIDHVIAEFPPTTASPTSSETSSSTTPHASKNPDKPRGGPYHPDPYGPHPYESGASSLRNSVVFMTLFLFFICI